MYFFFSSRRRHTRYWRDWSSDVCSSDLEVHDHEPYDEGDGRHHLEVDQRLDADPPDLLHVLHAGDAVHHRAEDDGRDQHLDQLDEGVAERLHLRPDLGPEVAEQDADHDGGQHLDVEVLVPLDRKSTRLNSSHANISYAVFC